MRTSFDVFDAFVRHKANEKIRRGNTYGEGLVFRGQRRLPPQRCPNFFGSLYYVLHLSTWNGQIRRGYTYGEWRVLGVSHANNKQLKLKQSDCITPLKMSIHIQLLTANMPYKCAFCIHVSKFSTERKSQRKTAFALAV